MTKAKPNTLFPGRPDYRGLVKGLFGLLHHDELMETSGDVMERVAYIKAAKPKNEIPIRLHNMIYLGHCRAAIKRAALYTAYKVKRATLVADYGTKQNALYTAYVTKRATLVADYDVKMVAFYADYAPKQNALDADYKARRAALDADYKAKRAALDADYKAKRAALTADYEAKRAPLDADYWAKRAALDADYEAKRAALDPDILIYIKKHIPDCAWDGKELMF